MNVTFDSNKILQPFLESACAKSNKTPEATFTSLPNDIIRELNLKYLSREEQIPLALVCKRFRRLCTGLKDKSAKYKQGVLVCAMRFAASSGNIALVNWIHTTLRCPVDDLLCQVAAGAGHLAVVQWAYQKGCPINSEACIAAARGGHLPVLQFLRQQPWPWDESTCEAAAIGGHLEVLRWAHDNGCPWNAWTCNVAAGRGHLEVLIWAHANGCPLESRACAEAALRGHLESCNGCALITAHGMIGLAGMLPEMATARYYNGLLRMAALGILLLPMPV